MKNYDDPAALICYLTIEDVKKINPKLSDKKCSKILDRFVSNFRNNIVIKKAIETSLMDYVPYDDDEDIA